MATTERWASGKAPAPRTDKGPSAWTRFRRSVRHGGRWFVRWPVRMLVIAALVSLGFLPYALEVGGACRVVAAREVALRAQLQDEIAEILVADGDHVEPGQVVARLSGRQEQALLDQAKAEVALAEANLKHAETGPREEEIAKAENMVDMWQGQVAYWESEHKRQEGLVKSQAGAVASMEQAMNSLQSARSMLIAAQEEERKLKSGARDETIDAARAKLDKAKASLALQEKRVPLCEIKSTIAGTISTPDVQLQVGQTVAPGDLIAVVRDDSTLRLEVLADEAAAEEVEKGQPVKIRLWGNYGELLMGHVEQAPRMTTDRSEFGREPFRSDREIRQEQVRYRETDDRFVKLIVGFDQPDAKLLPGMTGEARVVVDEGCFWTALWRPIKRFFLVEVWSWLP